MSSTTRNYVTGNDPMWRSVTPYEYTPRRYDPDTRMAKTYQVFAPDAIVAAWRQAGIHFVASGRQRPTFCSALGEPLTLKPTVG